MSVQGVFNTEATKQTGVWVAGWVQATALLTCGDLAVYRTPAVSGLQSHGVTPKYVLAGGVTGALITYTVIRSMAAQGRPELLFLSLVAQIIVAYLIELFGLFEWKGSICME